MKAFLVWHDNWDTGIPAIDLQHKAMARQLNRVAECLDEATQTADLFSSLEKLLKLTREHFDYEESLMKRMDYPDFVAHQCEHAMLKGELREFIDELEHHQLDCNLEMLRSLKQWFVGHIVMADRHYADFRHSLPKTMATDAHQ